MNILEVKDLCKTYIVNKRQNNVLKNVNFTIGEGEMVAVMGPSKSAHEILTAPHRFPTGFTMLFGLRCGKYDIIQYGEVLQHIHLLKDKTHFVKAQVCKLRYTQYSPLSSLPPQP